MNFLIHNVPSLVKEKSTLSRLSYLCKANFFGKPHLTPPNTDESFLAHPFTLLCVASSSY